MTADEAIDWALAGVPLVSSIVLGALLWPDLSDKDRWISAGLVAGYLLMMWGIWRQDGRTGEPAGSG